MNTTTKHTLLVPTVHLNGSSGEHLLEAVRAAFTAVDGAVAKLQDAAPNGRDYYPQGPTAINKAYEQHRDRLSRLLTVAAELVEIYNCIEDQVEERRQR